MTFFLSALLDNLTTTIVMISLMRKLLSKHDDRLFFAGIIVIALFLVAWAWSRWPGTLTQAAGWAFLVGIVVFSGSLYLLVLTQQRWLGAVTACTSSLIRISKRWSAAPACPPPSPPEGLPAPPMRIFGGLPSWRITAAPVAFRMPMWPCAGAAQM